MIPTIETKIAIPLALSTQIWGENTLSPFSALFLSFIGSMIPVYLILNFVRKIKSKTTGFIYDKLATKLNNRYQKEINELSEKKSQIFKYILLSSFVAIPIPLTGVWSGSLIAGLTNLNIHLSFVAIAIGSLISCLIMILLCTLFENSVIYILIATLIILILTMAINVILSLSKKKKGRI